jgi:phage N-6-adenine-methyltransferase
VVLEPTAGGTMTVSPRMVKAPPRDQNRRTPRWLFELIERTVLGRGKFQLDAAASPENALCKNFFTVDDDALTQRWGRRTFCNPGFARFGRWIAKGLEEASASPMGKTVVLVGPTGCSQRWFHAYAQCGTVFVPDRRISFWDSTTGEPTPGADRDTMIYVFGDGWWNDDDNGFRVLPLATAAAEDRWNTSQGKVR